MNWNYYLRYIWYFDWFIFAWLNLICSSIPLDTFESFRQLNLGDSPCMITRTSINDPFTIAQKRRSDVKCRSKRNLAELIARHIATCVYIYVCGYVCVCMCVKAQKNSRYARAIDAECKSARMRFSAIKRHTDSFSPSLWRTPSLT